MDRLTQGEYGTNGNRFCFYNSCWSQSHGHTCELAGFFIFIGIFSLVPSIPGLVYVVQNKDGCKRNDQVGYVAVEALMVGLGSLAFLGGIAWAIIAAKNKEHFVTV